MGMGNAVDGQVDWFSAAGGLKDVGAEGAE